MQTKNKTDKKMIFTLIAFIFVGILLLGRVFINGQKQREETGAPLSQDIENNKAAVPKAYYGKEAISGITVPVYDKNGNEQNLSTVKKEVDIYDKNGKMINLPTVSPKEYNKIKEGMSYQEVKEIIGSEGEIIREVDKPGDKYYTVCYFYYGDKAASSVSLIFQGNRLKSKANTGLIDKKK